MNLTYELIKTEIAKLPSKLCTAASISEDGKKFSLLMLKRLSGCKGSKLLKFFTEGAGEHQIDGIYFDDESDDLQINIITCKYFSNADKSIPDKDVTDFLQNGVSYLIFGEERPTDINDKVKDLKSEIDELRNDYEQKFEISLKFIAPSDHVLSTHGRNYIYKFQSELQTKGISLTFEEINNSKLSALFSSRSILKTPIKIKLSGKSYYPLTNREGFICRLPVSELINIYFGFSDGEKEYPAYGEFLFTDNVRKNLGLEKKINKKIYDTATTESTSSDFEHFNNGLTIIYDEKSGNLGQDSPILFIKGLQVVNGCQTVNTLIKAHEDGKLVNDIYITSKFIKRTEDQNFIQGVITYTNSQNAITDRDLHSNDRIQYDIQGILKNIGIHYERKLNEFRDLPDEKRLDAMDAAQAYHCCELEEPHISKQQKRRLFNELYNKIFDSKKRDLPYKLYASYLTLDFAITKQLENRKKKNKTRKLGKTPRFSTTDLIISHGSYHLATLIYKAFFKKLSLEQLVKFLKRGALPKTFDQSYAGNLNKLEKYILENNIPKEDLPKFFKKTGIEFLNKKKAAAPLTKKSNLVHLDSAAD